MHTKGQSIIVSGGSRGLGLHLCERLLEHGNKVATFARSRTEAMDRLQSAYGDDFRFTALDATDEAGVTRLVRDTAKAFGRIHSLVNNAAIGQDQLLMHTDAQTIRQIIEINIFGPTILTKAVVKHMLLEGGGNICNISSICGSRGYAGLTVYAGSKGSSMIADVLAKVSGKLSR